MTCVVLVVGTLRCKLWLHTNNGRRDGTPACRQAGSGERGKEKLLQRRMLAAV
jgi:hypothetical protein